MNATTEQSPAAWVKGATGISKYANVSTRTAQSWLAAGLPAKRLTARLLLVRPADIDEFIERQADERSSRRGEG